MHCLLYGTLFYFLHLTSAEAIAKGEFQDYQPCLDHKEKEVPHGDRFFPLGSDPCTQCTCLNGKPQMCLGVFCSPPEYCQQYYALNDECCKFVCLDPKEATSDGAPPINGDEFFSLDSKKATSDGAHPINGVMIHFLSCAMNFWIIRQLPDYF